MNPAQVRRARKLALKATEALNEQVFTEPGLSPRGIATLVKVLGQMRHRAGDF